MQFRTDLAMECRESAGTVQGVTSRVTRQGETEITSVVIETEEAAREMKKAPGQYVTLYQEGMFRASSGNRAALSRLLGQTLRGMLPERGDVLVVGLGNRHMTADALGSRVIDSLLITRHLRALTDETLRGRLRGVCAVAPGVLGMTGMETAEVVRGIVEHVRPAAVLAIDALAARETSRICTTIQITDTGILPGSGVGNHRLGLTRDTLHVPVMAVGVPMVVYASIIARDALGLMLRDLDMPPEDHRQAMDSLISRITAQGMGELVVTPREIDEMTGQVAGILADGINLALQPELTEEEIRILSHDGP